MERIYSRIILAVSLIVISCNKDGLTKETEKGANTFSCLVDGQVFKPVYNKESWGIGKPLTVSNNTQTGFGIYATDQKTHADVFLESPYILRTGTYKLFADNPNRGGYSGGIDDSGWYTTDSTYTGELTITRCDLSKGIYSGTFYFTAIDNNTGRTVQVTGGRFDVKEE